MDIIKIREQKCTLDTKIILYIIFSKYKDC